MSKQYDDHEQVEQLKAWLNEYGRAIVIGVLLGGGAIGGYRYWEHQKDVTAAAASELYEELGRAALSRSPEAIRKTGKKVIDTYPDTPYADLSGLMIAKTHHDAGDIDKIITSLQHIIDHPGDPALALVARLRLARIQFYQQKQPDQALTTLEVGDAGGFISEFHELRGDIFLSQGKKAEAKEAYQKALVALKQGSYRRVLDMKLANTGSRS